MSLGPVDWVGGMHNEKIVSVCFVKIGYFGTKGASTGIWGPVEWIEDQLNWLETSLMGYNDQSIYMIQKNNVSYLILRDFGTPNNLFLFNAFIQQCTRPGLTPVVRTTYVPYKLTAADAKWGMRSLPSTHATRQGKKNWIFWEFF